MKLENFERAKEFYERAEGFLIEHEACHSLMLGLASQLVEHPELVRKGHYLATAEEEGGEVKAAALMTPPYYPVLSLGFTPGGIQLLVEDLHESYPTLPGVLGPVDAARSFAETWSGLSGQPYQKKRVQRIHQLEKVVPVVGVSGRLRRATEADRKLLTEWFMAFTKEALGEDIGPQGAGRSLDAYLGTEGMGLYLWEDGQAVSIAGRSRPTPNGTTVNYVYTPPVHRNRGYASACVAALSQLLLDEGYRYCFLFTDLANPTSNKIYRTVGYEPVCDVDEYEFGKASGGRWAPRS
jgi:GNAT superfamily N-acetyltransferase